MLLATIISRNAPRTLLSLVLCSTFAAAGCPSDAAMGSGGHAGNGGTAGVLSTAGHGATAGTGSNAGMGAGNAGATGSTIIACDQAAPGAPGCVPDPGVCSGAACDCNFSGTFVVHTITKSHWTGTKAASVVLIKDGQAELQSWGIWTLTQNGTALTSTMQGCGGEAPEICSPYFKQAFAQGIDNATWDAARVVDDVWQLQMAGAHVTSTPHATMLGLRLTGGDPLGAFPSSATAAGLEWVDDDSDAKPGVTVSVHPPDGSSTSCGLPYGYVPVDQKVPTPTRATAVFTGVRTIQTLDMTAESCNLLRGTLNDVSIEGRVQGCTLESGQPCSSTQAKFLDSQPNSQVIDSITFTAVRVAAAPASCVDVRGFVFP